MECEASMRSRAYTGDAGKSSVTMLKIWPTPLRIRTSPINRTRNHEYNRQVHDNGEDTSNLGISDDDNDGDNDGDDDDNNDDDL